MTSLAGKVALVTGGALGIGGATARRLAAAGAHVFIADVNAEAAAQNVARIETSGGVAAAGVFDVSEQDQVQAMVDATVARFGRLDYLVNNAFASRGPDGSAETIRDDVLDFALTMMVKSLVWAVRFAVPHMQPGGAIVNIASVHGFLVAPRKLAYETGKAAVIALTKQIAVDLGPKGIRANAICPGHIVTERMQEIWDKHADVHGLVAAQYPVGRTGTPDDIAHAVRFLVSDEAAFITGHALVVDGGMTVQLQEDFGFAMARYMHDHPELQLPNR